MEEEPKINETEGEEKEALELEKPLDKLTGPELREIAKEIPGVEGVHAMKKEELLVIIKKHRGIKDEESSGKTGQKGRKASLSSIELKNKITQLRGQKAEAREAAEKKKVDILRRRINRIKKQSRKAVKTK